MDVLFFSCQGQEYNEPVHIPVPQNCNGITFINRGDVVAYVNGIPLSPNPIAGNAGESISFGGNLGEIYAGRATLSFASGGANPLIVVVFKFYVNPENA